MELAGAWPTLEDNGGRDMKPKCREIQTKNTKDQKFQINPDFLRKIQLFQTNADHWEPFINFHKNEYEASRNKKSNETQSSC